MNRYDPIFNVLQYALHPPAVIIAYQHRLIRNLTQLRLAILCITHAFHPLPDRDRSRIASGLLVRRLPPLVVTLLLIVRVTLSGDTRNVLAEYVGIEPTHRLPSDRLAICCLNRSANTPDTWCLHLDSNQEPSDYESLATNQLCYRGNNQILNSNLFR